MAVHDRTRLIGSIKTKRTPKIRCSFFYLKYAAFAEFLIDYISLGKSTQAYKNIIDGKTQGAKTVLYEKSIGEQSYYVVQAIPDTKAKTLFVVSVFIGKKGYKKEASQFTNTKSLGATSEIGTANTSISSISPSEGFVKHQKKKLRTVRSLRMRLRAWCRVILRERS